MQKKHKINFDYFLEKFPEIDLPITLTEDSHFDFGRNNQPLPIEMVNQFLVPKEDPSIDEYTEYIPCFRLKKTEKFHAIVHWKASLLNYQYIMTTYDLKGIVIDRSILAGTKAVDDSLLRSVATIDEDWIIYVMAGVASYEEDTFDPASSKSFHLELLSSGKIISGD